jgi:hypothetical protein
VCFFLVAMLMSSLPVHDSGLQDPQATSIN